MGYAPSRASRPARDPKWSWCPLLDDRDLPVGAVGDFRHEPAPGHARDVAGNARVLLLVACRPIPSARIRRDPLVDAGLEARVRARVSGRLAVDPLRPVLD